MARNFDEELPDELSFVAAGETFTMKLATTEELAVYEDMDPVDTGADASQRARDRTTSFLIEGDRDRWTKVLDEGRIPYVQMKAISEWMLEVQSGRPTTQPSPSEAGPGSTARGSKGRSS